MRVGEGDGMLVYEADDDCSDDGNFEGDARRVSETTDADLDRVFDGTCREIVAEAVTAAVNDVDGETWADGDAVLEAVCAADCVAALDALSVLVLDSELVAVAVAVQDFDAVFEGVQLQLAE